MSDFRHVVEIRISAQRVWEVLLDVERWPVWTTSVSKIQRMDLGPLTLGSRTRIWQPRLMPAVWQVTSLDEKRRIFAWTTHTCGIRIVGRHQVDALGERSRVSLSLTYYGVIGAVLARAYRDLNWEYLTREANGLRGHCEAPAIQHASASASASAR
jgi:uncharacterized membrane protein